MFSFSVLKCSPPMFFCRLATLSRIILLLRKCSPRSQNNHVFISDASYKYICTYYVCTYNYLCHSLQEHFTIKVKLKRKLRKDSSDWKALLFHSFSVSWLVQAQSLQESKILSRKSQLKHQSPHSRAKKCTCREVLEKSLKFKRLLNRWWCVAATADKVSTLERLLQVSQK